VATRFVDRGGLWLVGQAPLMVAAFAIPAWLDDLDTGPGRWIGFALFAAGIALGGWARRALGESFTPFPKPVDGATQVARGPYRFVRHPIYSGIVMSAAGWALAWNSIAGALLALSLLAFFDMKARREERWLESAYPGYAGYRRRTRKLVPFLY
jgi:protein-S-isoprenylcysteine O-methyltransferase Ste14